MNDIKISLNTEDIKIKKDNFSQERWEISFYCKDCQKIVKTKRKNPKWYIFICEECNWSNITIWTNEWLKENYRIK